MFQVLVQSRRGGNGLPKHPKSIPCIRKFLKHCLQNPDAISGVPAFSKVVSRLREFQSRNDTRLTDLVFVAADYMSTVIHGAGEKGSSGPKILLKYIQAAPGFWWNLKRLSVASNGVGMDLGFPGGVRIWAGSLRNAFVGM